MLRIGMDYYKEMGFDEYGFSQHDQRAICDFYEFSQTDEGRKLSIQPISKEDFEKMQYMKEYILDVCLLWCDSNNNYGGAYVSGSLRGKVMVLSHDEPRYAPLFRSIPRFLERAKKGAVKDLYNPQLGDCDYPAQNQLAEEKKQNVETARQFLDALINIDDEDEYYQTALKACYLMPVEQLGLLIPLLRSGNMYVEQGLPDIFVFHSYKGAVPALGDAIEKGSIHAKSSAKRALAQLGNPLATPTPKQVWPAELFVFPGETPEEAQGLMAKIKERPADNNERRLADIAYSLVRKCDGRPIQYVLVAGTWDKLLACIDKVCLGEGINTEDIYTLNPVPGKVAFVFSGQGSQRVNMAADLFLAFPRLRKVLDEWPEYESILFPQAAIEDKEKQAQRDKMMDTRNAQPLLGIVDLAVAELWRYFGVEPDMVAGHSYGELPALCFTGAFDAENLVMLSRARAEAILDAVGDDPGRMAAVLAKAEVLADLLDGEEAVWAVNYNGPRQTVVAGTTAGMAAFLKKAKEAGAACQELNVACAFHSPLLLEADKKFAAALKDVAFQTPDRPVWSNTDAKVYPQTPGEIKERLASHLVSPVLFTEEVLKMRDEGGAVFVEAGPGGAMIKLVSGILRGKEIVVIQTERSGSDGLVFFLQGLAKYISTGRMINLDKLFEGREVAVVNID
ncbi:MAG: ACP S-malonyltransferase [Peptococcaceae bacterium]|nr:ACP S-malonyltransferase [Peptococcaceae bacterium]